MDHFCFDVSAARSSSVTRASISSISIAGRPSILGLFYDETLSDRVSKALQHAVDLCGGGRQDPF
jgi:hypothetical protein